MSHDHTRNLFAEILPQLPKGFVQTLIRAAKVRIERIVSHGMPRPEASGRTRISTSESSC